MKSEVNDAHIVSSFDKDLKQIETLVVTMGGLVEHQIEDAAHLIVSRDLDLAEQLISADKEVDALEQEVDALVVKIIALRQPKAQDLRAVLAALKVAADLERISDYTKNLAKRIHILAKVAPVGSSSKTIKRMCLMVCQMVKDVLDSYLARDIVSADDVRLRDEEVDQVHNNLFRALLTYMLEDPRNITPCMHLLFISKNIERMGDHTTNIAEQVHFMIAGEIPDDERPKGDITCTTYLEPRQ
ncbi:phosphate signaling complex protein PhoU [Candidatus Endowatersipora endosymbiont of Watersipora subatra]|uniref:phosphate signaling complex protein PhoU n=1 Tax=Candidatus Endowatersipora endosymbiont of Watersipora subatra TaxID=3077946 RepID=UPI00312C972E